MEKELLFPIRRGQIFLKLGGVQIRRGLILTNQRGPNPEGSRFCQSGRVLFVPIRRGIILLKDLGRRKKD